MRRYIAKNIDNCYFLCADLWNFKFKNNVKKLEMQLSESNIWNIASGLSQSSNKDVYIYGVAGFLIHRYEGLRSSIAKSKEFLKSNIIILNAGKVGYKDYFHQLHDDLELMKLLDIPVYEPETIDELKEALNKNDKVKYIRLGKDF